jgi:hypothetical protein
MNTSVGVDGLLSANTLVGLAGRFDNLTSTGSPSIHGSSEGWSSLVPSLGLGWLQLQLGSYRESSLSNHPAFQEAHHPLERPKEPGKASYSLRNDSATYTSMPLELALRFEQPIRSRGLTITPRLQVGYSWDLADSQRPITAAFQAAPHSRFTVKGTPAPSSWWDLGLGMDVALNEAFSVYLEGQDRIAPGSSQSLNYGGGFRWRFRGWKRMASDSPSTRMETGQHQP